MRSVLAAAAGDPFPLTTPSSGTWLSKDPAAPVEAPLGTYWRALLLPEGCATTRVIYTAAVLKRGAPHFVDADVRMARSVAFGHGPKSRREADAAMSETIRDVIKSRDETSWQDECIERFIGSARLMAMLRRGLADAQRVESDEGSAQEFEPYVVGRVVRAWYEPWDGIVGVVEFTGRSAGGPFEEMGLTSPAEFIGPSLFDARRRGAGELLRISVVLNARCTPAKWTDGLPAEMCLEIASVEAVDLVVTAATDARLIEPINA